MGNRSNTQYFIDEIANLMAFLTKVTAKQATDPKFLEGIIKVSKSGLANENSLLLSELLGYLIHHFSLDVSTDETTDEIKTEYAKHIFNTSQPAKEKASVMGMILPIENETTESLISTHITTPVQACTNVERFSPSSSQASLNVALAQELLQEKHAEDLQQQGIDALLLAAYGIVNAQILDLPDKTIQEILLLSPRGFQMDLNSTLGILGNAQKLEREHFIYPFTQNNIMDISENRSPKDCQAQLAKLKELDQNRLLKRYPKAIVAMALLEDKSSQRIVTDLKSIALAYSACDMIGGIEYNNVRDSIKTLQETKMKDLLVETEEEANRIKEPEKALEKIDYALKGCLDNESGNELRGRLSVAGMLTWKKGALFTSPEKTDELKFVQYLIDAQKNEDFIPQNGLNTMKRLKEKYLKETWVTPFSNPDIQDHVIKNSNNQSLVALAHFGKLNYTLKHNPNSKANSIAEVIANAYEHKDYLTEEYSNRLEDETRTLFEEPQNKPAVKEILNCLVDMKTTSELKDMVQETVLKEKVQEASRKLGAGSNLRATDFLEGLISMVELDEETRGVTSN